MLLIYISNYSKDKTSKTVVMIYLNSHHLEIKKKSNFEDLFFIKYEKNDLNNLLNKIENK